MTTPEYKFGEEMVQADASADRSSEKFNPAAKRSIIEHETLEQHWERCFPDLYRLKMKFEREHR